MSTITLTVEEIVGLYQALPQLDGYQKVNPKDSSIAFVPYELDDTIRWDIIKNKKLLKTDAETYEERRKEIISELSPTLGDVAKEDSSKLTDFNKRTRTLLARKVEIPGLLKFNKSGILKDNKNPIPSSILELLMPIIDETK